MSTRTWRRAVVVLAIGTGGLLSCISERSPVEPPAGVTECALPLDRVARGDAIVLIRGQQFLPDTVRVRQGQAVTWVNCEPVGADPHTSTSLTGIWDSPLLQRAEAYSRTFTATGTFGYTCIPHPHMRGGVIVE